MKFSKLILFIFTLVTAAAVNAQNAGWTDNIDKAKAEAKAKGKYVFLNFSGSDWCGWCMKLSDEVLSKDAFLNYAKKNLVLTVADFPRTKKQSAALKSQNEMLAKKYGIQGFPTVVILDPKGKLVTKTGYRRGGAEAYVTFLKGLIKEYEVKQSS